MMKESLKRLYAKSKHNPSYFLYFLKNKHIMRNHFPILYKILGFSEKKSKLDIGSRSNYRKLHIILRTTDFVMNINSSRQLENIGIITKNDVIKVGGCSLFRAASHFSEMFGEESIQITLVVDRLSDIGLSQYRKAASAVGLSFDVVDAIGHGNGPTFQTQINVALSDDNDTIALILEDDYLLSEDAFTTCFSVMKNHYNVIGMNPHFHPDRVRRQDIGKMTIVNGQLYSQVYNTCCTFFMPVCQMRRYERFLRIYDGWEDGSVNSIWEKGICLAPLGWTLAEHLHRNDLSPVNKLLYEPGDN